MCWYEKCCLCIPLDLGVVLMSIGSFVVSTFVAASSAAVLILEREHERMTSLNATGLVHVTSPKQSSHEHFKNVLHWDMEPKSFDFILAVLLLIGILGMVFSLLLVYGVRKRNCGLVLSFFSFGILMTIITLVVSLLELLQNHWIIATLLLTAALVFIHWVVVVHTIYDRMQRGQDFGCNPHLKMDDQDAPEDL